MAAINKRNQHSDQSNSKIDRRGFLNTGATISAALLAGPTLAGSNSVTKEKNTSSFYKVAVKERTLGSGKWAIKVSTFGLGCMGMSYHRSFIPDKKYMVDLIRKAVDMGVNLFDTAEAYGFQIRTCENQTNCH